MLQIVVGFIATCIENITAHFTTLSRFGSMYIENGLTNIQLREVIQALRKVIQTLKGNLA